MMQVLEYLISRIILQKMQNHLLPRIQQICGTIHGEPKVAESLIRGMGAAFKKGGHVKSMGIA